MLGRRNVIYIYHHHVPLARISLTLSRHFSLSFIASGRSSELHPISSHSCCMYVRAGRPAFVQPYVGVRRNIHTQTHTHTHTHIYIYIYIYIYFYHHNFLLVCNSQNKVFSLYSCLLIFLSVYLSIMNFVLISFVNMLPQVIYRRKSSKEKQVSLIGEVETCVKSKRLEE